MGDRGVRILKRAKIAEYRNYLYANLEMEDFIELFEEDEDDDLMGHCIICNKHKMLIGIMCELCLLGPDGEWGHRD